MPAITVTIPNRIRLRLQDCEIGEVVPVSNSPCQAGNWLRLQPTTTGWQAWCHDTQPIAERLFKRVIMFRENGTNKFGTTFKELHLWKRIH